MNYYFSDPHFNHANIIKYSERPFVGVAVMNRALLDNILQVLSDPTATLVCCGDWALNFRKFCREYGSLYTSVNGVGSDIWRLWPLAYRDRIVHVAGNHDSVKKQLPDYLEHFAHVVGTEKTWRSHTYEVVDELDTYTAMCFGIEPSEGDDATASTVVPVRVLCSHAPQEDLQGCDINVHGHIHNTLELGNGTNGHHPEYDWTWDSPRHLNASVELTRYKPMTLMEIIIAREIRRLSL